MVQNHDFFSEDHESLLDLLLAEEGLDDEPILRIAPRSDSGPAPLTYAQSRIWFLEQVEPGGSAFLIPTAVRLKVPINAALLEAAFQTLWRRHTILDAVFYEEGGQVWQRPGNFAPPSLRVVDLTHLAGAERETAVTQLIADDAARPFNLDGDPLIRAALLQLQNDDNILLLTIHHIVADGWSVNILLRELVQIYLQKLAQQPVELPQLPVQYTDYAHWQQEFLTGEEAARQLAYWKEQLAAPLPVTELPADYARPTVQTFNGGQERLTLPPGLTDAIRRLTRQAGVTLYMTLLTAFKTVLHRQTGQDEIVIGSPVAGRQYPELEPLVGLFLNSLVLRSDLGGNPTFLEALARVRTTCVDAFANQDVPFEQLLIELNPARDASRTPFFQIFFNMLQFDRQPTAPGVDVELIASPDLDAKFDMTLYVEEVGSGIELTLVYNRDLFREARMVDLLRQYQLLLQQAVVNPDLPLSYFSLLTEGARAALPDMAAPLSDRWEGPISARLDYWAQSQPGETAVSDDNSRWTYQQVAAGSSRLAHFLRAGGVESGDVVAVYGRRCAALVTAVMGIFKAGAATLILDPTYPDLRIVQYLETAEPAAWLYFDASPPPEMVQKTAMEMVNGRQLTLPEQPEAWQTRLDGHPDTTPDITIHPDDMASLTFTSGSTGQPKAVMGRHRSLTHFYPWMVERFQLTAADRFSMLSGLAHDPLQRDMFTALWVGAEICVPDPERMWEPGYMGQWLRDAGITVAHLIPSMIYALVGVQNKVVAPLVRYAFFVGEALTRNMVKELRRLIPGGVVVNLYGASETQRAVSYHAVNETGAGLYRCKQEIPLGAGMPGAQLLVLTPQQTEAGIGELGELYMRSPHLALGYWRDAHKTARQFMTNPLTNVPEDRLYRTGDYGRFLPNGEVEFAGRQDSQVNVRGFRVELGEIEAAILSLPDVASVVVTAVSDSHHNQQIAAYVVPRNGTAVLTSQTIREHVKQRLPLPMVPASVTFMNAIPLTPNGKIDRQALPRPNFQTEDVSSVVAPRDHIEEILLAIWRDLLPEPSISVHDDFFTLGGHSILAIQMFSRIRDELDIDLNIGLLFQASTIAELAKLIRTHKAANEPSSAPHSDSADLDSSDNVILIRRGAPGQPNFFCVHGAGGHVLFMQAWQPYFDQWSIWGLESPSVDGLTWPKRSIEEDAAEYVANLQKIQPHGPYLLGGYSGGGALAYEMAQQLKAHGEQVDLLVLIDTHHPSIRPRSYDWKTRIRRFARQPWHIIVWAWRRKIAKPVALWYLIRRYVDRGARVPLAFREPLISYYFVSAKRRYKPKPYGERVLLVRSLEVDHAYSHAGLRLGWDKVIESLDVVESPSNHFTVVQEPFIQQLSEVVLDAWERR